MSRLTFSQMPNWLTAKLTLASRSVPTREKLVAIVCAENSGLETHDHGCWVNTNGKIVIDRVPRRRRHSGNYQLSKPANLLSLVQVCRMVYTEAITILYDSNVFDINHIHTFTYLQQSLLPRRLNQIRVLNFSWNFYSLSDNNDDVYSFAAWTKACDILASFTGLQELTLHLTCFPYTRTKNRTEIWKPLLEPLMHVRATKKFDIFLPWSEDECTEAARKKRYPFSLATKAAIIPSPFMEYIYQTIL